MGMRQFRYIRFFSELGIQDVGLVGGKNASLGEMYRALTKRGVRVPNGFATTVDAFFHYLRTNGLQEVIRSTLAAIDPSDVKGLAEKGAWLRHQIVSAEMPADLEEEIALAYQRLEEEYQQPQLAVAVRSSATAEDLPQASFAGQQESWLNIRTIPMLVDAIRRVFASLYTDRAIAYRIHHGFAHEKVGISAGVQKMVRSDQAASGVIFTIDTESGFRNVVLITAAYGLGENVVRGVVDPDEYEVFKPALEKREESDHSPQTGEQEDQDDMHAVTS